MSLERLNNLAILAIECELAKQVDLHQERQGRWLYEAKMKP